MTRRLDAPAGRQNVPRQRARKKLGYDSRQVKEEARVVLEKLRFRGEPGVVTQLREHKWTSEEQKKELLAKFQALSNPDPEYVVWTATDPVPEIRAAGVALLRKRSDRAGLAALLPLLRTRSEAVRRAVQRFLKEAAGNQFGPFLLEISSHGDDWARLSSLDMARELPADTAFDVAKRVLTASNPTVRARALKAVSEMSFPGSASLAASLAVPLLQDENEEIRYSALSVLEKNPNETYFPDVLQMARTGSGRVMEASFAALKRLLSTAKQDHTPEIVPLLADGNATVRAGAVSLLLSFAPDLLARRILEHFRGSFVWVRDRAVETATAGLPNFVMALLALTNDPDAAFAKAASEMTLALTDARAIPVWLKLVDDPDFWVKSRALETLGKYGHGKDEVVGRVLTALKDPDVALSAASALGDLGDPRAASPLFEAFKTNMTRPDVQLEALDAMAKLAHAEPRVGAVLTKIAQTPQVEAKVREKARRLVGRIQGDAARDAIPEIEVDLHEIDLSANASSAKLVEFLADTVQRGASDLHLATGFVPHRRMQGQLEAIDMPTMTRPRAMQLIREVLPDEDWKRLEKARHLDVCLKIAGLGRFRANFFSQRSGFDASFRVIPRSIPTIEEIGLPESVSDVLRFTQGLVLVTGPSGCGKSTTLAALVDRINETRPCHIVTIEDPVEFVHPNKEALVNQRQVPHHTASFARALRAALREDPDVILVGEMRDLETIALAITASETGHLVLGTVHTTNAPGTIDRVVNSFPAEQQQQIRVMLADSLKAVISQSLLPRRGIAGRVAAFEIMRLTPAIAALIREGKTHQLPSLLQTGQLHGMCTMDQSLLKLVEDGKIDPELALEKAQKKEPFERVLEDERKALE
jgi:twitching motility protein PilT